MPQRSDRGSARDRSPAAWGLKRPPSSLPPLCVSGERGRGRGGEHTSREIYPPSRILCGSTCRRLRAPCPAAAPQGSSVLQACDLNPDEQPPSACPSPVHPGSRHRPLRLCESDDVSAPSKWKQPRCPSRDDGGKRGLMRITGSESALKKREGHPVLSDSVDAPRGPDAEGCRSGTGEQGPDSCLPLSFSAPRRLSWC